MLGQLQKNFKILLRKLIRNGPPNHAIASESNPKMFTVVNYIM